MATHTGTGTRPHPPAGTLHTSPIHDKSHHRNWLFEKYRKHEPLPFVQRKQQAKLSLTPMQSAWVLTEKNKGHANRVAHASSQRKEEISTLLVMCSDARMGGMLGFDDFSKKGVATVYVAGNVSDILHSPAIKEVLSRMAKDSSIIIMGHACCGAVAAASHKKSLSQDIGKNRNLLGLVEHVHSKDELSNLVWQQEKLSGSKEFLKLQKEKGVRLLTAFADIEKKGEQQVGLIDGSQASKEDISLIESMNANFREKNAQHDLSQKQFVYATVISSPSLQFDAREIFDCKANEIFVVSAGDYGAKAQRGEVPPEAVASAEMAQLGMLDQKSIGSIEYSVEHVKSRHIVLLHTNAEVANQWEADLLQKSRILTDALVRGEIEISVAIYDSATGKVNFLHHLVSEKAHLQMPSEDMPKMF